MKKWFKDTENREIQYLPIELRGHSDGRRGNQVTDKEASFVIMWYGKNENNWTYQVGFNCSANFANNMWHVFIFDESEECVVGLNFQSKTILPPVWNREFGGIDYDDYIFVMKEMNKWMNYQKLNEFRVDYSKSGKFIHFAKLPVGKTLNDVINNNLDYEIVAVKAECYKN